jgi:photosystem II stability/assembly factor-like uncharacterized protein
VGGEGTYRFHDGKQFQRRDELTSEEISLYGVWGFGDNDVYIVGSHGTILHFDGNEEGEWKLMESGTEEYLLGVWGSSPSNIFAVGDNATVLHYDGNKWCSMDPKTDKYLTKVRGLGPNCVYAVGDDGLVIRFDGEKWNDMSLGEGS